MSLLNHIVASFKSGFLKQAQTLESQIPINDEGLFKILSDELLTATTSPNSNPIQALLQSIPPETLQTLLSQSPKLLQKQSSTTTNYTRSLLHQDAPQSDFVFPEGQHSRLPKLADQFQFSAPDTYNNRTFDDFSKDITVRAINPSLRFFGDVAGRSNFFDKQMSNPKYNPPAYFERGAWENYNQKRIKQPNSNLPNIPKSLNRLFRFNR